MLLFGPDDLERDYPSDSARVQRIAPEESDREQEGWMTLLHQAIPDRAVLDDHPPFFWRMTISTNRLDSWGTIMANSSLKNYAADATEGRAFLIGHNKQMAPVGYSLQGRFVGGQGGGVPRTDSLFYTLRGMEDTDAIATRLQGGLLRDASISFGGREQRWICSIDGMDMLRATWEECAHIPGVYYKKDGTRGRGAKGADVVLCTASVEDAHMSETSGVYRGATPGAGVVKATRAAELGLLDQAQRLHLEEHYRIHLPGEGRHYSLGVLPAEEGRMANENRQEGGVETPAGETPPTPETPRVETPAAAVVTGISPATLTEAVRALGIDPGTDPLEALRAFAPSLTEMRVLADAGAAYRKHLVDEAITHGVRAMGDTFKVEVWRAQLEGTRDVAALEAMRDNLRDGGNKAIPAGRATRDDAQQSGQARPFREYPASAYRS